jgi:hypothetical protein
MAAGGSVSLELLGTTTTNSVPGRPGEVVSPISVIVLLPRVVEYNESTGETGTFGLWLYAGQGTEHRVLNTV